MGTVVRVLQLTDGRRHHMHQFRIYKECVEPYFHNSYAYVKCCLGILMAAQQAGVVKMHIYLLVCGTPNDADSSTSNSHDHS
jgi:hypothetical protein